MPSGGVAKWYCLSTTSARHQHLRCKRLELNSCRRECQFVGEWYCRCDKWGTPECNEDQTSEVPTVFQKERASHGAIHVPKTKFK
eukprot:scaffold8288_cov129-Cylindrotheca_fusiformis.AAC.7